MRKRRRPNREVYNNDYVGIVEDISDPKKIGRVKVRIESLHGRSGDTESIPTSDLIWLEPSSRGNTYGLSSLGTVVYVAFEDGDYYKGSYFAQEHFDINLQNKLESLTQESYENFYCYYFDSHHQYYYEDGVGIIFDYVKSNINLTDAGDIKLNLKDNNSKLYLGTNDATQQAVLGNHWIDIFTSLVDVLIGIPYLGNLNSPVIPSPDMIAWCNNFYAIKETLLSKHVFVTDNEQVNPQTRAFDVIQSNDNFNYETLQKVNSTPDKLPDPVSRPSVGGNPVNSSIPPTNYANNLSSSTLPSNPTPLEQLRNSNPINGVYQNGQIPLEQMTQSSYLSQSFTDERSYLLDAPSKSLDDFLNSYGVQKQSTWSDIIATKGYQNLERQQNTRTQYPVKAPLPGKDPFGFGNQVELYFGVDNTNVSLVQSIKDFLNNGTIPSPDVPQVDSLKWLIDNGSTYGWKLAGRTSNGDVQWWHWIYSTPNTNTKSIANLSNGMSNSSGI